MEYFNNYTVKYRAWDKERKIMAPVRSLLWSQDQMIVEVVRTDPFNQNSTFERFYDPVLMQHINDKDKDCDDIYVGDFLIYCPYKEQTEITDDNIYMVIWAENGFYLWRYRSEDMKLFSPFGITESFKIVGNVFENPELLGEDLQKGMMA